MFESVICHMNFRTLPWKLAVGIFAALSAAVGVVGILSILTESVSAVTVTVLVFFASALILALSPWLRANPDQPRWHSMFAAFLIVVGALFAGNTPTVMGEWSSVAISGVILGLWGILEGEGTCIEITVILVIIGIANLFAGRLSLLDAVAAAAIMVSAGWTFFKLDRWIGVALAIVSLGYFAGELFADPQQIMSVILMIGFAATGLTLARRYFLVPPIPTVQTVPKVSPSLPQVVCPHCGGATPDLVGLCGFCGDSLSAEPQPETDDQKPTVLEPEPEKPDNIIPFRKNQ